MARSERGSLYMQAAGYASRAGECDLAREVRKRAAKYAVPMPVTAEDCLP